jgi:hypothetical protein
MKNLVENPSSILPLPLARGGAGGVLQKPLCSGAHAFQGKQKIHRCFLAKNKAKIAQIAQNAQNAKIAKKAKNAKLAKS